MNNLNELFKRKFRNTPLLCLLLFLSGVAYGQNEITVRGVITDSSNEKMPGVSINIKGESGGTMSDKDGEYSIEVERGETLVFSYIGFDRQEIEANRATINVQMEVSADTDLDEVIVVGYGSTKKRSLVTSVSEVKQKT